jgi:hypothetical protein
MNGTIILVIRKSSTMKNDSNEIPQRNLANDNKNQQAFDKSADERGKTDQVTNEDLKGKKVDAHPENPMDQPIRQLP